MAAWASADREDTSDRDSGSVPPWPTPMHTENSATQTSGPNRTPSVPVTISAAVATMNGATLRRRASWGTTNAATAPQARASESCAPAAASAMPRRTSTVGYQVMKA